MAKFPSKIKLPPLTDKEVIGKDDVFLTEDEKLDIQNEVASELASVRKAELKRAYMNRLRARMSGLVDTQHEEDCEEYEDVMIDLPGHSNCIVLDGKSYFHGNVYAFNRHQVRTVNDIMARAWQHEGEIGGAYREHRQPINAMISPRGVTRPSLRF